jgi:hypothetical protein
MTEQASIANNIEQAATLYISNQPHNVPGPSGPNDSSVQSYINIGTKPLSRTCPRKCPCQCHVPVKAATPRWLRGLIGVAFVNFTGTPLLNHRSCNFKNCDMSIHGSGSVRFSYLFPTWLLRTGVDFTVSWRDVSGIGGTWSLKMPRMITDTQLFHRIRFAIEHDSTVEFERLMAVHGVRAFDSFEPIAMLSPLNVSIMPAFTLPNTT